MTNATTPDKLRRLTATGSALAAAFAGALLVLSPAQAQAQLASGTEGTVLPGPRVFLDCQGQLPCDRTHFRTEIRFVNWAQDREDSDVHVIATSQMVGGGGRLMVLDFIGRGEMENLTDRLTYTSSGTDVQAETLDGLTQTLRLGLMRYAIHAGLGQNFDVRYTGGADATQETGAAPGREPAAAQQSDPWNFWTFRVGASGNFNLRETSKNYRFNPNFSADRVTEDWKLSFGGNLNLQREERELTGGRIVKDNRDDWDGDGLIVRSVNGHVSAGFSFGGQNSVSGNQDARVDFAPTVEWNYYPYLEANRRQLIVQYSAGVEYSNYIEETLYNAMQQTLGQHRVSVRYNAREQWGNAGVGANYSQYLHDTKLYRAGINGNLSFRITRGLDLNMNGNASWVHDEIHIPLSDFSDEDILLGRANLPSAYQYNGSIGLSYRWGSTFTNIVNTRMGGQFGPGGGGGGGGGNFN